MDYNGRDEKETQETQETQEAQEEFPLYTERIIINPKVKYKKLFSFLKFLGGAVIFGVIACAVIVLLYPYFDKKVNGAGNVSAVIAIYLFSKYAADPYKGLMETINLKNTDTDTLGSMVGALFGALHGDSWIPIELRGVQDYKVFEQLIVWLLEGKEIFDEK